MFVPCINKALSDFVKGWNRHTLSKTGGLLPMKLYTKEIVHLHQSNSPAFDYFDSSSKYYGSEDDDVVVCTNSLDVPLIDINLSEDCLQILKMLVDPLSKSESYGINLYERILNIVQELLTLASTEY